MNPIKVCVSIPSMGYTSVEAYCNRLVNFMHLGKIEDRAKTALEFISLIKKHDENLAVKLLGDYFKDHPQLVLSEDGRPFEFYFSVIGRIFTPVARDEAAKMALESGCDYLYMIDDDMLCPDDMFEKLYAHNVDIVAPLAFTRNPPHKPVMYQCIDGYDPVAKKDYFVNSCIMNYPKDKLVEVDAVGFGAVLIKMWVIKTLRERGESLFMSTCGTGEDIYFCYKAKKIGARVFMDTATKIGHIGNPLIVDEPFVDEYRKKDSDFSKKYPVYAKYGDNNCKLILGD